MRHGYRQQLTTRDIDSALRARKIEPLYGFTSTEYIPLRYASGGGRELHFNEDSEVDLQEFIDQTAPKIPAPIKIRYCNITKKVVIYSVNFRAHWLCIDGVQPNIPENPAPIKKPPEELIVKKLPDDVKDGKDKDKFNKDKKLKEQKEPILRQIEILI